MIKEDENEPLSREQDIQRDVDVIIFCDTIVILDLDFRNIQKKRELFEKSVRSFHL